MKIEVVGWDIGGAHLKAAAVDVDGRILAVRQEPCPLWQGTDHLHRALDRILARLAPGPDCRHAATMTGELVDAFNDREEGVATLVRVMAERCAPGPLSIFAGPSGFLAAEVAEWGHAGEIASANWLASGSWLATHLAEALFVDVGTTTTDLLLIHAKNPVYRGYADGERMRYDELLYTGVVRTPVMALATRVPIDGEWMGLMAEHFATTADIYRLTGELPEYADQMAAADGGPKTEAASRRRLARMVGKDAESVSSDCWRAVAQFLREKQLGRVRDGIDCQLSRGFLGNAAPLVGAGVGRFLVRELARRLQRSYLDFSDFFSTSTPEHEFHGADCAPAMAVGCLALREVGTK